MEEEVVLVESWLHRRTTWLLAEIRKPSLMGREALRKVQTAATLFFFLQKVNLDKKIIEKEVISSRD